MAWPTNLGQAWVRVTVFASRHRCACSVARPPLRRAGKYVRAVAKVAVLVACAAAAPAEAAFGWVPTGVFASSLGADAYVPQGSTAAESWGLLPVGIHPASGNLWWTNRLQAGFRYRLTDIHQLSLLLRYANPATERWKPDRTLWTSTVSAELRPLVPSLRWSLSDPGKDDRDPWSSFLLAPAPCTEPVASAPECPAHRPSKPVLIYGIGGASAWFRLLDCDGSVAVGAVDQLSVLARAPLAERPTLPLPDEPHPDPAWPEEWVDGVRLVHPRLLWVVEQIARAFPRRPIQIYSGYRRDDHPSPHRSGRALDLAVVSEKNATLYALCRSLKDVGCGYYPNHPFVHVDVRPAGQGSAWWTDISMPGEPSRFIDVGPVPRSLGSTPAAGLAATPPAPPVDAGLLPSDMVSDAGTRPPNAVGDAGLPAASAAEPALSDAGAGELDGGMRSEPGPSDPDR